MDGKRMFYIDTLTMCVDLFDVDESQISNRRPFIKFDDEVGYPDGMCTDTDDNLWVAFWQGYCVRGFDGTNGKQIAEIKVPSANATSCVFGGEKLDKLIITSAVGNPGEFADLEKYPESGFVFITSTSTTGKRTNLFGL
jgi:gluconolactonase